MSKKARPPQGKGKKDTPRKGTKSSPAKKSSSKSTPSRKPKKQSKLGAALNGRLGLTLIGATLIFGALMLVAMLPLRLALFPGGLASASEKVPTLIAAPLVVAEVTLTAPEEADTPEPEPEEAESVEEPEVAALPLQPGVQPTSDGTYREARVPVLMYHYVSVPPEDADVYRLDLSVTPEQFESQLDWLDENGYTTILPSDLLAYLNDGVDLPDKPVMLTFDDGYRDNYENAFPILEVHNMIGTFFILTGETEEGDPNYVTWDMLREMSGAGQDIQMHAHIHIDVKDKDAAFLQLQMDDSAAIVEERLGYRPHFYAYPGGAYDERAIEFLKEFDYWLAFTTQHGCLHTTENPYELQRIRVRGEHNLDTFAWLVSSAFEDEEYCYGYG